MTVNRKNIISYILIILIALAGVAAVTYQTREGAGVTGDSVYYIMGAQNMLSGNGYSRYSGGWEAIPITGFPPLFSAILAGVGFLGADLYESARIINILLFGANIFLAGYLTFRYTRAVIPASFSAMMLLASNEMIRSHSFIMTEGLYIFLTLLSLLAIVRYFETNRLLLLIVAGLLMAASTMTRYIGLATIGMAGLGLFLFSHLRWKKRLVHIVIFGMVSVLPFILWMYRNSLVRGNLINRQIGIHFMSYDLALGFISEAVSWFAPRILHLPRIMDASIFLFFTIVIPLLFLLEKNKNGDFRKNSSWKDFRILPLLLMLLIPCYVIVLLVNNTFLDTSTSLGATRRYLLPVYAVVVIMLTCIVYSLVYTKKSGVKITSLVIGMILLGFLLPESLASLRSTYKDLGYTNIKVSWTSFKATLNQNDGSRLFISDNVELFYYLADRPAYAFIISYDTSTPEALLDYQAQIAKAKERLENGAVIVLFSPDERKLKVIETLGAEKIYENPQAVFYHQPEQ